MEALRVVVTAVYVVICIALTIVVIMQEGKSAGLGAISGMADTYWGKNKGRSLEGKLEFATKILATLFIVLSLVLNMSW